MTAWLRLTSSGVPSAILMLDQRNGGAVMVVHVEHKARHVLLLFKIHPGHWLVEQKQFRFHGQRAAKLHPFLQAIRKPAHWHPPDFLDLEKIYYLLDAVAVLHLLAHGRAVAEQLPEEARMHLERAACHDVVERGHAAKQRDVLKRPGNAAIGRLMRAHIGARLALECDASLLRVVESVDDIEHRRLAGAIRPDNGPDFALADIERDVAHGFHAAKRKRHILHRQKHIADRSFGTTRRPHAAFPMGTGSLFMSRIFTRALIVPLRPSSKVTSVEMSASFEPS
jgi:hypothetical protein